MRLRKVILKGFRSIKREESLLADDRVTILIGANDHGKSNLLAAIHCLNDDKKIEIDDGNWDLESSASIEIEWHFDPSDEALNTLRSLAPVPPSSKDPTPFQVVSSEAATPATSTDAATPADPATPTEVAALSEVTTPPESTDLTFPISEGEIVFWRDAASNKVRVTSLPLPVSINHEDRVLGLRPRVELFAPPSTNLIDQVTQKELETDQFEFMQGIFHQAGLWEHRKNVFAQNDTTSRKLKEASTTLTKVLNDTWKQGSELKWIFEHTGTNGDHIGIRIEDPAIQGRYTRPSLRSSGFKTYFLLSMIIYARTQKHPSDTHIYLFDEPGTYLHPAAQLDLQRSFETIADQAQIFYTTHSLFLVSKNYPQRNRVVSKTADGTKIDQKPFSKNWKSVRDSLGILLSNNFLIAEKTLFVEGPSDIIYLLDAIKKLKATQKIDIDLNDLSIVDAGDSQNYSAMAKIMLSEGRNIVALLDGDASGKRLKAQLEKTCAPEAQDKRLQIHCLPDGKSTEDVFANVETLKKATKNALLKLVEDGARVLKEDFQADEEIEKIIPKDGTTLGRVLNDVSKSWFKPQEPISKLLIATLYEDLNEPDPTLSDRGCVEELKAIAQLLNLRGEKSKEAGVFTET